ncbi:MAG TPA: hypothetical protein VF060_22345 [Trebonia sp.]
MFGRLVDKVVCGEHPADDQVSEGVRNFAIGFEAGPYVLLHGERNVGVTDPL